MKPWIKRKRQNTWNNEISCQNIEQVNSFIWVYWHFKIILPILSIADITDRANAVLQDQQSTIIWAAARPTKWPVRSVKTQTDESLRCLHEETLDDHTAKTLIRMGRCPGWYESSLGKWRNIGSLCICPDWSVFAVHIKKSWILSYSMSTHAQMSRLIWVFTGRKGNFLGFVMRRLILLCIRRGSSIGSMFAWHASGPKFDPHIRHILLWRLGHENISTAILPLLLIQEEQLYVTGEKMCTKYW